MAWAETLATRLRHVQRRLEPWGWKAQWLFQATAALLTASVVTLLMLVLDGASLPVALGAGLLAMLPAVLMGSVALNLARSLALSENQRQALSLDEEESGLISRRHFMRQVEHEWFRCQRYGDEGALLLVDPDLLRNLNARHGERCVDRLLQQMDLRISGTLRQSDWLARFEGPELAVFLPHTDALGAVDVAERIRQLIAGMAMHYRGVPVPLTVSVGVAPVHAQQPNVDSLLAEARGALLQAKAAGRNCVRAVNSASMSGQASRSVAGS